MLCLLLVAACAGSGARDGQNTASPGLPSPPSDPIAAFAAQASPGANGQVVLADGRPASLRLLRSYHAASGRECREVLVGAGAAERSQVVCMTEAGGWAPARPLLRGAGATRQ